MIPCDCDKLNIRITLNKSKSYRIEINKLEVRRLNWIYDKVRWCNL